MPAFTYERDLDHPVSAEVEQSIRATVEPLLHSQGLDRIQVIPGLDHDGGPKVLIQAGPAVRQALWPLGERRFPHLRYDFHANQQVLGSEDW
jgi:hypothetical protein